MFYIIDFFNIFSDYREIVYKKNDIDFHSVKHENKEKDTFAFFELFFTKYIKKVNIKTENSSFIFILKKIHNYDCILNKVLKIYSSLNIHFLLIENEFKNKLLDKNKDDFLCQYIFFMIFQKYKNCILISNDKYRDKLEYIQLFNNVVSTNCIIQNSETTGTINVKMINHNKNSSNSNSNSNSNSSSSSKNDSNFNSNVTIIINQEIINLMKKYNCTRCTIPKYKLDTIL